jgi:sugar O-acyltransferase (sialic acid O-acetyltransferase NeuD family)
MSNPTPNPRQLVIIGAGGHGRVCADVARRAGWDIIGFCDPAFRHVDEILGVPVIDMSEQELFADWPQGAELIVAIGDNARRLAVADEAARCAITLAVLADPSAVLSPSATLGPGSVVMPGAVINAEAFVGRAALINTAAVVEQGARVGQGAHIAPGACLTGDSVVGERSMVGARATLLPGVQIGRDVSIGAGAVVTRDSGDATCLIGIPATAVRQLKLVDQVIS